MKIVIETSKGVESPPEKRNPRNEKHKKEKKKAGSDWGAALPPNAKMSWLRGKAKGPFQKAT